jgi:hypothetical protein
MERRGTGLITATQLILHGVGDYLLQSHWMATNKTKDNLAAACHAFTYGALFLCLNPSPEAWAFIILTHFVIDRWRLARFVVFAKNFLAPRAQWPKWQDCQKTGYPSDCPDWLAFWLLITADNLCHILLNGFALKYL